MEFQIEYIVNPSSTEATSVFGDIYMYDASYDAINTYYNVDNYIQTTTAA